MLLQVTSKKHGMKHKDVGKAHRAVDVGQWEEPSMMQTAPIAFRRSKAIFAGLVDREISHPTWYLKYALIDLHTKHGNPPLLAAD